jgi:hypothetical protein
MMAEMNCPTCGQSNPEDREECQFCGARLTPLPASASVDSQSIKPGEVPTRKNTADLENALPSWLRSLRKGDEAAEANSTQDEASDQDLPLSPPPDSSEDSSDWLAGLGKAASAQEEIPEWLANLRNEKNGISAPDTASSPDPALNATGSLSGGLGDSDWAARLDNAARPGIPEQNDIPQEALQGQAESPGWLDTLKSNLAPPAGPEQPAGLQGEGTPDWLTSLPASPEENEPFSDQPEDLPEWLNQLKEKAIDSEPIPGRKEETAGGSITPDWLDALESAPGTVAAAASESLPDWLSNLEAKTGPEPDAPASVFSGELPSSSLAPAEIPDWLSQFQADVNASQEQEAKKEQFEQAPPSQEQEKETEPLPDWLSGIQPAVPRSDRTPALITNDEGNPHQEKGDVPFSMEMPDWLSKLTPEKVEEKVPEKEAGTSLPGDLEISELPSWVQAMRPVESVVSGTSATPQEDAQVAELSGPLAGLQGVLPAGPGLGSLRKPSAYSTVLQVSDGQQRYAASLERLISNETQPLAVRSERLGSNRLWHWLIAALLILAVGLPLITNIPITPAGGLQPPEMVDALALINNLPSTAPVASVLLVFDYEPALSGELEAAAAPLFDRLMLQGPHLALISTNPTGPALAERFLHDASPSPLIAGQQVVNLGYLPGGPAGVLYFAISPTEAAPLTQDVQPAWQLPPLLGIQRLSDFSAIIVLTDNADSGRVWIEQTGSELDNTPMLMVISAQIEPMILPYYDSGQIKGLVTGLAGGEAFDQTFDNPVGKTGLAKRYWDSFSAGTLVAEILIIIGAFQSMAAVQRNRRSESGEGV